MATLLTVLVVVLVATNLATLAALVLSRRRAAMLPPGIASTPPPGAATSRVRRLITVEILNPIELAAARGRVAGIAGSVIPEVTRRIVYDKAAKILKRDLAGYDVVADVRIQTVRPPQAESALEPAPVPDATDEPADQPPV